MTEPVLQFSTLLTKKQQGPRKTPPPDAISLDELIWNQIKRVGTHWYWFGYIGDDNRAVYRIPRQQKTFSASRYVWESIFGKVADDAAIKNTCGLLRCVNPEHYKKCQLGAWMHENPKPAHCGRGHNNWSERNGGRYCRTCDLARQKKHYLKRKQINAIAKELRDTNAKLQQQLP